MPRPWTLTVAPYPDLTDALYAVRVKAIEKRDRATFAVHLAHTVAEQLGRTHTVALPLPIRPAGLAAQFFATCGFETHAGQEIQPSQAEGRILQARFERDPETGDYSVIEFRPARKEQEDAD